MNFTQSEKIAIANILIELMNANKDVSKGEVNYMTQIRSVLRLEHNEIQQAKELHVLDCIQTIRKMSNDKKLVLTVMMQEMIKADGDVDPAELRIFILVAKLCNLPIEEQIHL